MNEEQRHDYSERRDNFSLTNNPLMKLLAFIGRFIRRIFTAIGVLTFIIILSLASIVSTLSKTDLNMESALPTVPETAVLYMNFNQKVFEYLREDSISKLFVDKSRVSVYDIVTGLRDAANDPRVKALYVKGGSGELSYAQIEEIRDSIESFRAKGKLAVFFAEDFGIMGSGTKTYFLASAFDRIYLQNSGTLNVTGLYSPSMFVRGTLDKIGVKPEGGHRSEYKTYWNMFTEKGYTDAHKESAEHLTQSIFDQVVAKISKARKMEPSRLKKLIDNAPYSSGEAVMLGLIDGVKYSDEAKSELLKLVPEKKDWISMSGYIMASNMIPDIEKATMNINKKDEKATGEPSLALIVAEGSIHSGASDYDPFSGDSSIGSDTYVQALNDAAEDKDVKAIIFRVNSPGGSVVASESIWRAVENARAKGKKVVVSMSSVAASGGYYISASADKILVEPTTITGSIGVVMGKMYTKELFSKLGITFDSVKTSENADLFSALREGDEKSQRYVNKFLDLMYSDFKSKVGKGRKLNDVAVEKIAKGRVWSGTDALKFKLADGTGGYLAAFKEAKILAGLNPDAKYPLKVFPKEQNFFEMLFDTSTTGIKLNPAGVKTLMKNVTPFVKTFNKISAQQNGVKAEMEENTL